MTEEPGGRLRRCPVRVWRFIARHGNAALLLVVAVGLAGLIPLVIARYTAPTVARAGQTVVFLLSPVLVAGMVFYAQRLLRRIRRSFSTRGAKRNPRPANRPIEDIAADLRRLLWQHHRLARSANPAPNWRLRAIEVTITACAVGAARALDVRHPEPPTYGGFDKWQLCRLLRALAAEGLVLPSDVELMTLDSRR